MSIDEQELQEWVKSLRNVIASSGFGEISDEGIYWIIYEYGKLLKNKPSDLEIAQKALESKEPEPYDAGFLNDFGGGNVSWWHDYIRSELEHAHDHYAQQFITPARITEQDALEIIKSWSGYFDQETFEIWSMAKGRALLNKLNADRERVQAVAVPDVQGEPENWREKVADLIKAAHCEGQKSATGRDPSPFRWVSSGSYKAAQALLAAPTPEAVQVEPVAWLSGEVCGGDASHNTVNVVLDDPAPWIALPICAKVAIRPLQPAEMLCRD